MTDLDTTSVPLDVKEGIPPKKCSKCKRFKDVDKANWYFRDEAHPRSICKACYKAIEKLSYVHRPFVESICPHCQHRWNNYKQIRKCPKCNLLTRPGKEVGRPKKQAELKDNSGAGWAMETCRQDGSRIAVDHEFAGRKRGQSGSFRLKGPPPAK